VLVSPLETVNKDSNEANKVGFFFRFLQVFDFGIYNFDSIFEEAGMEVSYLK